DAGHVGDVVVDELADVDTVLDVDLHQQVVLSAGRIELGGNLAFEQLVGDLIGPARRHLKLHEYGSHRICSTLLPLFCQNLAPASPCKKGARQSMLRIGKAV